METARLFGTKIEVIYTNCDTIAKDESVRLYLSSLAEEHRGRKRDSGDLIFDYDPNGNQTPPTIEGIGDHKVLISIGDIGTVFVQKRMWRDISINYRIGQVRYPSAQVAH